MVDLPWQSSDPTHLDQARAAEGIVLRGQPRRGQRRRGDRAVHPWAVDASRLERSPGVKDHDAVRAFVEAAGC